MLQMIVRVGSLEHMHGGYRVNVFLEKKVVYNASVKNYISILLHSSHQDGSKANIVPSSKPKPIYNINLWTSAFHIYVAIYSESFLHEMEFECDMACLHSRRYYNSHFRNMKQRYSQWPWGQVMNHLWNRALLVPTAMSSERHQCLEIAFSKILSETTSVI